jgi:hypothetical protein
MKVELLREVYMEWKMQNAENWDPILGLWTPVILLPLMASVFPSVKAKQSSSSSISSCSEHKRVHQHINMVGVFGSTGA